MSKKETMDFQTSSKITLSLMLKPFLKNQWRKEKEQAPINHLCNLLYHPRRKKIQIEGKSPKHLSHHRRKLSKIGIPTFSMVFVLLVRILDINPWCVKHMVVKYFISTVKSPSNFDLDWGFPPSTNWLPCEDDKTQIRQNLEQWLISRISEVG